MTVRPKKDKHGTIISYEIRVFRGRDTDGKQLKPYTKTWKVPDGWSTKKARKEAEKIGILFEKECKNGMVPTEQKTFAEYAAYCIDMKERNGAKVRTVDRYREMMERLNDVDNCGIGYMKLADIRPDHLNRLYAKLSEDGQNKITGGGLSPKTIIEHHHLISTVFTQAVKEQLVPYNVASRATPPKLPRHEAEVFEVEEVEAIICAAESIPTKWKACINLLIATGARRGEIAGLQWKNIDFQKNRVYLCNNLLYAKKRGIYTDTLKTDESRYVTVAPSVMQILLELKKEQLLQKMKLQSAWVDSGYLLVNDDGTRMNPCVITRYLSRFYKKNNLPHINPHKFRHTQASLLINQGVDIVAVSKRLGHKKVSTTCDIYAHIIGKADEKSAMIIDDLLYKQA